MKKEIKKIKKETTTGTPLPKAVRATGTGEKCVDCTCIIKPLELDLGGLGHEHLSVVVDKLNEVIKCLNN